ncbi:MAG: hypothetical protein IJS39_14220 [Synergistaceae bacterium]|nr:hypothetical protein [Synergistaceae bacterium]
MTEEANWYEIAGEISGFIGKMESQHFSGMSDRHGLVKITKKLYEALEIAQKAIEKGETE